MAQDHYHDDERRDLLRGAVDLHLHTAPSIFPRAADDFEVAAEAATWGVAGFVLKAHEGSTAERAYLVNRHLPGAGAAGSLVLNHFVGGLNPHAVQVALAQGARMVWLPTIHAANHLRHYGGPTYSAMASSVEPRPLDGLSALDSSGTIRDEVLEIVDLVRDAGAVLATGHLGRDEVHALAAIARQRGLERLVVTHPDLEVSGLGEDDQARLAGLGAYLELTALNHRPQWGGLPHAAVVQRVRRMGAERFVLASDFGQRASGPPWEAFAAEVASLLRAGLGERDLEIMLRRNPRALLG